jgi:hypothetical protein
MAQTHKIAVAPPVWIWSDSPLTDKPCSRSGFPYRKNILFGGRIEPLKGIDTLFGALAFYKPSSRQPPDVRDNCGGDPDAGADSERGLRRWPANWAA